MRGRPGARDELGTGCMSLRDYHKEIIIILDFGSQYTQLIARKVRELKVYCEIFQHNVDVERVKSLNPVGIILSGGPRSVTEPDAPACDPAIFRLGAPVLGICYGIQLIAKLYRGEVQRSEKREYGRAHIYLDGSDGLLEGMADEDTIWMSHGDRIMTMPPGFRRWPIRRILHMRPSKTRAALSTASSSTRRCTTPPRAKSS